MKLFFVFYSITFYVTSIVVVATHSFFSGSSFSVRVPLLAVLAFLTVVQLGIIYEGLGNSFLNKSDSGLNFDSNFLVNPVKQKMLGLIMGFVNVMLFIIVFFVSHAARVGLIKVLPALKGSSWIDGLVYILTFICPPIITAILIQMRIMKKE